MKKLAVLIMIPGLVMFMAATMASANGPHWRGIHGNYAMIATGSCLHSTLGFENLVPSPGSPVWTPISGSAVWGASTMAQATWTFERDGSGTVSGTNYVLEPPPFGSPRARQNPISLTFIYEVTDDGEITVTYVDPTQFPPVPLNSPQLHGWISTDHKTLTLGNANIVQPFGTPPSSVICNNGRVLIRVKGVDE